MFEFLAMVCVAFAAVIYCGIQRVPEGYVAVYYRGGALQKQIDGPGFRFATPLLTKCEVVQTTIQTDNVMKIPCGTAGGIMAEFERIEVVNRLAPGAVYDTVKNYTTMYDKPWIYDKIHHEINQICSASTLEEIYITRFDMLDEMLRDALQRDINKYVPGLTIISIRVTKPKIPAAIRQNYEDIENERTKIKVANETLLLVQKQAETDRAKAIIEAEKAAAVEEIRLKMLILQKENEKSLASIQNEILLEKTKADADAKFYSITREADANKMLITPEFLQLESVRAISNNTKIYFGEKIPQMYSPSFERIAH